MIFKYSAFICLVLFIIIGCSGTKETTKPKKVKYADLIKCPIKMVKNLEGIEAEYSFIDTCFAQKKAVFGAPAVAPNMAMPYLIHCACEKGGDLIEIIDYKYNAYQSTQAGIYGIGISQITILKDQLIGLVYRSREDSIK